MTVPIPGAVVFTVFFVLSAFTFSSLLNTWSTQANDISVMQARQADRINTCLSISSASGRKTVMSVASTHPE